MVLLSRISRAERGGFGAVAHEEEGCSVDIVGIDRKVKEYLLTPVYPIFVVFANFFSFVSRYTLKILRFPFLAYTLLDTIIFLYVALSRSLQIFAFAPL